MANQAKLDVLSDVVMALIQDRKTTHQRDQWAPVLKGLQDRYNEEQASEPIVKRPPCMTGGCSRPAQVCTGCANMLKEGAMHQAWEQGWDANETRSGDLEEHNKPKRGPSPPPESAWNVRAGTVKSSLSGLAQENRVIQVSARKRSEGLREMQKELRPYLAGRGEKRNPYPPKGLQHVCGQSGFGRNIDDVCEACQAYSAQIKGSDEPDQS